MLDKKRNNVRWHLKKDFVWIHNKLVGKFGKCYICTIDSFYRHLLGKCSGCVDCLGASESINRWTKLNRKIRKLFK